MADDNDDDDNGVGYRKPPKASQFKKGQSGNPSGRPRKPKAPEFKPADSDPEQIFEREMGRIVRVTENGKTTEMPAAEAIQRAQVVKALQGSRLTQNHLLDKYEAKKREELQEKKEFFELIKKLKQRGSDILEKYKEKGLPPPDLIPHPDEIELCYGTYDVIFHGPATEEEDENWKQFTKLRDYFLRLWAQACKGEFVRARDGKRQVNFAWYLAQLFNGPPLPRRYRWTEYREIALVMSADVSEREWKRQLAEDHAWIDAAEHFFPTYVSPEMVALMKRFYKHRLADIWFDLPSDKPKKGPKLKAA